ncbi:hypothetical protein SUGI_0718140 [Cryptomeria japonica]|nr:hypothetical protein SUGI_0718140 [Cryptomeria japonica]
MKTPSDAFYNSTAYIKVQRSSKHTKLSIIARCRKAEQKQRRDESDHDEEDDDLNLRTRLPMRFSFQELQNTTNDISVRLGSGGFGSVYEGILHDGTKIAVKRLDRAGQGGKQFKAEV